MSCIPVCKTLQPYVIKCVCETDIVAIKEAAIRVIHLKTLLRYLGEEYNARTIVCTRITGARGSFLFESFLK